MNKPKVFLYNFLQHYIQTLYFWIVLSKKRFLGQIFAHKSRYLYFGMMVCYMKDKNHFQEKDVRKFSCAFSWFTTTHKIVEIFPHKISIMQSHEYKFNDQRERRSCWGQLLSQSYIHLIYFLHQLVPDREFHVVITFKNF